MPVDLFLKISVMINYLLSVFCVAEVRKKEVRQEEEGSLVLYSVPVAFGFFIEAITAFFYGRTFGLIEAVMLGIMPLGLAWLSDWKRNPQRKN